MSAHFRSRRSPARLKSSELFGLAAVFALLAALLYATVLAGPAGAQRQPGPSRRAFAEHLLKLDPGRRIGGDTIVGVSNGDLLLGVANRINFMVALGSGETIVGGNRDDQLGALGKNATINGGAGNDKIHGGPGHDTISGGPGDDLITDTKGSATINTGTGKNEVEVAGHPGRDRVLCASGSVDRIFANHGDSIAPSCRKAAGSQVVYHQPPPTTPPSAAHNGCDTPAVECAVKAASGTLRHFWASDVFTASCPLLTHPFLRNKEYVFSPLLEARGLEPRGNVDFFAPVFFSQNSRAPHHGYAVSVHDGLVTNWTVFPQDWEMWFHCTSDKSLGYKCPLCLAKQSSGTAGQPSNALSEKRKAIRRG